MTLKNRLKMAHLYLQQGLVELILIQESNLRGKEKAEYYIRTIQDMIYNQDKGLEAWISKVEDL